MSWNGIDRERALTNFRSENGTAKKKIRGVSVGSRKLLF